MDEITLTVTEHVATVTLNRPQKLNAMSVAMDRALNEMSYEINNERNIRVVVLTGAGERAFSAGSDISDLGGYGDSWQYRNRFDARLDYARAIWLIRKPVIAAIHGYCIGGGLEMACASDIRLATPTSTFAAGEVQWGWHGGSGATQYLARQVGTGHAATLLMTGDKIDADEAQRIGLVQQLVEHGQLMDTAVDLANRIAGRGPVAVERIKHMLRVSQNVGLDAALHIENDSFAYCMTTEDAAEGQAAFTEKRRPVFRGR